MLARKGCGQASSASKQWIIRSKVTLSRQVSLLES